MLSPLFLSDLLSGVHDFQTDEFKMALYSSLPGSDVLVYTPISEVSSPNYPAGGVAAAPTLAQVTDFQTQVTFPPIDLAAVTFVVAGLMLYNVTKGNKVVAILPVNAVSVDDKPLKVLLPDPFLMVTGAS